MVEVVVWIYQRRGYRLYRFFVMKVYESEISVKGRKKVRLGRLILRTRISRISPHSIYSTPDEVKKIYVRDKIFKRRIMEQN